jgi:hypothetical protein
LKYAHSATLNTTEFTAAHLTRMVDGVADNKKANDEFAGI